MGWAGVAGKRVVITGATGGIGLAAAEELAMRGAKLMIVARDEGKASRVANRLGADVVIADLASKKATRRAADEILARCKAIDVLVNNAGVYQTSRTLTEDWIETTWAVNHVATFMLTNLLLERIEDSAPSRIVITASDAHVNATIPFDDLDGTKAYAQRSLAGPGFVRYGQTKLANILFTTELARRLDGTGVTTNCFHPGLVATGITRDLKGPARFTVKVMNAFARKPSQGAETLVWLVDSPDLEGVNGGYFSDKRRIEAAPAAKDVSAARRLWEISEIQAGLSVVATK